MCHARDRIAFVLLFTKSPHLHHHVFVTLSRLWQFRHPEPQLPQFGPVLCCRVYRNVQLESRP